jgi:uncharacterized metal-binding protein YceD (DUF177 family)
MQINISNLSEGTHTYSVSDDAKTLGLSDIFNGTVVADVTLEKSMDQILVTVNASVKGIFVCDRCTEEFEQDITNTFRCVYSWEKREGVEDEDDYYVLRPDENMIDLSANVRDYLTLSVPLKTECGKKGCTIPPVPRQNDETAVDPRWERLRTLLKTEKN